MDSCLKIAQQQPYAQKLSFCVLTVSVLCRKPVQEDVGSNGAGPGPQGPSVIEEMSAQAVAASLGAAAASVDDASSLLASQDGSSILDPLVLQVAFCILDASKLWPIV